MSGGIDAVCLQYVGKAYAECSADEVLAVCALQAAHLVVLEEYCRWQREVIARADIPCLLFYAKTAEDCTADEMRDALERARRWSE